MEVLSGPRLQLLWEDIVYAVLSIVNEDAILDHLQNCFKIPEEEFSDLKDIVVEAYKKPQIHIKVKTVKITSYPHIEDDHGIVCVIKIGENLHHTREESVKWMWDVDKTFNLETLWDQKLEIETWQDQEKDAKANLSRVCLRSLDQISKKIRLNLKSQTLTSFYPTLPGDKSNILSIKMGDDQGNNSMNSITRDTNSVKEDPKLLQDNNDKRRDTIHVSDSNWVLNAFSSLKRSNLKKKSISNNGTELSEDNYIDIRSPIPTGQDSLAVMQRSWSVKSERSFFSKYSSKPGYKLGSQTDKKDLDKGDIKTKPEVQVRRQLFRDFLTPTSVIPENEPCHLNSDLKIPLHEVKSMPKLHSISDFIPITLKYETVEESSTNSLSKEKKISLMKGLSSPSLKTGSLTLSAKNEFQLWKRASLSSSKERKISAPAGCNKQFLQEQSASSLSIDKLINNNKNRGYDDHDLKQFTKNKTKIGSASVDLKELFMKMPCSNWSVEEEVDYISTTHNKIISPIKSLSKVKILLELKPRLTLSSMPAFRVFILCLKQILTIELQLQVNEDEGMGMYLPLRKNSKLILKCLAFSYNLSEAHLSLACWLVLINGHSLDHLFNTEAKEISSSGDKEDGTEVHSEDSEETLDEEKEIKRKKSFGFCGEIHPKYFFHWLEKTELFVSSSSFDEEKEKLIFSSLENFIESFCQQLRRIHATFPISHASHLTCGLRCVNLLSVSESLRNIVSKYGKDFDHSWPKSNIFDAVLNHANNWINALHDEIIAKNDYKKEGNSLASHSEETLKPAIVTKNTPLMQTIMNGEKAMLALNDFIGLGEKVYESIFKRELDESYLELIWPTIISILETVLNPLQNLLHTNQINITQDMESMQDLHMYLWILLLQLSKLQRFQISMEKQTDIIKLPESFAEAFFLLSRLWLRICLLRVEEMVDLECQADSLTTTTDGEEGISSSARELTDVMHVMHEKISRFSFPPIKKFKENLALYLEDGLVPVIETYQRRICPKAVEIAAASNTLTAQMCVALNNVQKVSSEAEALINFLFPQKGEEETLQIQSLRVQTKEASFFIFSKSLPRLQTWVTNALSTKESDDFLLDWIKSVLEALFVEFSPQSKLHTILLQQFWDYVFIIMKEKQKIISQPKDFRFLGNFMEKLYYMFKVSLRVHLHSESETAFKEFMKTIQLKASLTSEVIQVYYADRLKEQMTMQTNRKPLVINAYFCKNKGLKVDIYVCPSVEITNKDKAIASTNNKGQNSIATLSRRNLYEFGLFDWKPQNFPKDFRVASHVKKKAASVFVALTKSSTVNYYVKVHPVPSEWFKKVSSKKTKCMQKNPPVFEDQLSFNIKPTDGGVINGGFLIFRLKYSSVSSSAVDSEAILPLKDIPILSSEEKLENKHTYLTMSAPSSPQDYETLQELLTRKQDKDATAFITQLEQSYWANQSISH